MGLYPVKDNLDGKVFQMFGFFPDLMGCFWVDRRGVFLDEMYLGALYSSTYLPDKRLNSWLFYCHLLLKQSSRAGSN